MENIPAIEWDSIIAPASILDSATNAALLTQQQVHASTIAVALRLSTGKVVYLQNPNASTRIPNGVTTQEPIKEDEPVVPATAAGNQSTTMTSPPIYTKASPKIVCYSHIPIHKMRVNAARRYEANFISTLKSWTKQQRQLVLQPCTPMRLPPW